MEASIKSVLDRLDDADRVLDLGDGPSRSRGRIGVIDLMPCESRGLYGDVGEVRRDLGDA